MKKFAGFAGKGAIALGGALMLGAVTLPTLAFADYGTDYSTEVWNEQVAASMGQQGSGANLNVPAPISGPITQCGDVIANQTHYASNLVRYCRAHNR